MPRDRRDSPIDVDPAAGLRAADGVVWLSCPAGPGGADAGRRAGRANRTASGSVFPPRGRHRAGQSPPGRSHAAIPFRLARAAVAGAAVAGVLVLAGAGATSAGDPGGRPLTAVLTWCGGARRGWRAQAGRPRRRRRRSGDSQPRAKVVCWDIEVSGIATPTRGHIHQAPAGVNGPIVVVFFEVEDGPILRGCTTPSATTAQAILRNPADFYVNVHNADFPAGALRGQLSR